MPNKSFLKPHLLAVLVSIFLVAFFSYVQKGRKHSNFKYYITPTVSLTGSNTVYTNASTLSIRYKNSFSMNKLVIKNKNIRDLFFFKKIFQ